QCLWRGLAGLAVVADPRVPDVDHLVPLGADRLALGRPVLRGGAVAHRRLLNFRPESATQAHGAEDGGRAAAEPHGLVEGVVPARGRAERATEVLDPGPPGEDADAQRVLEVTAPSEADHLAGDLLAVERIDSRGQPELVDVDGDTALEGAGRAGARVEHLVPARAMVVAARRGADFGVDGGLLRLAAELLGSALDAFAEDIAESFAAADHLDQPVGALDIAPLQLEPELLSGDEPALLALHHPAAHPAEFVDVEARAVELGVEPRDPLLVGGADRPPGTRPAL